MYYLFSVRRVCLYAIVVSCNNSLQQEIFTGEFQLQLHLNEHNCLHFVELSAIHSVIKEALSEWR